MMKFSELVKYCESNNCDCFHCEKKDVCNRMTDFVEEATPVGIAEMVAQDKEF